MLFSCSNNISKSKLESTKQESAAESTAETKPVSNKIYRTLDEIKQSGTINIGVFSDKYPFGYVDEYGEYRGYDVYFANRIGKELGVKVNFISTEAETV